ncbi:MAG: hypothetical protein H6Q16_1710 [Bacteroidetes bacterium]|nr:hypothetical protein [Bacteroidota bacterium]
MKKNLSVLVIALFALTISAFSQTENDRIETLRKATLEEIKSAPKDAYKEYFKNVHARTPFKKNLTLDGTTKAANDNNSKAPLEVPSDMIYPGEFDEVQAVIMTWPYITRTVSGNQDAEQLFEGKGMAYNGSTLVDVYSVPYLGNDDFANVFRKLAYGIQQYSQVWINIWNASDSTLILQDMTQKGMPLTNYRFFINNGNSFWYRDCGPVAFYYGEEDQIGFMDFEYYGGRPLDDLIAKRIGEQAGFSVYTTTIEYEGGNILVDGLGALFTSSAVYALNADRYGLYYLTPNNQLGQQTKTPLTKQQVNDSLTHLMNLDRCVVLPELQFDGGTGHIDLYADMVDEATFVSTKHPEVMANLSDPIKVEQNMDSITGMFSSTPFGQKYYNTRIPLPAKNNGAWYTSQPEYNDSYTRSYTNHTFVNGAIMQPVFYNSTTGDVAGNLTAIEKMKQTYPGYDFVEIDVREFDGFGGAIHCITKQVPAENPVRIYHYPVRWLNTTENPSNGVWLTALAQNKSGIESAKLYYRTKGQTQWNEKNMNIYDGNIYDAVLPINPTLEADTIEYYISATSNNGKTINKPITAPKGFYTFVYGTQVQGNGDYIGIDCMEDIKTIELGEFFPNPAQNSTKIEIPQGAKSEIPVKVINLKGQVLANSTIHKGQTSFEINTSSMRSGNYWVIFGENTNVSIKKILVVK